MGLIQKNANQANMAMTREPRRRPFENRNGMATSLGTLAEMIGTTRTRVNFFMNKFRNLGFIEDNGTLQINASLLRIELHE